MTTEPKTILLTGATSGIGREMAQSLAQQGANLVLACRNPAKAEALCAELRSTTGNPHIATMSLDLASLAAIRTFCSEFRTRYTQVHVLINNAGAFSLDRRETVDGFELTMGTNFFGPFLLTCELAPLLAATPGARIVNVGSAAYRYGKIDLNDLQLTHTYDSFPAYAASKLAVQFWTQELAARLAPAGVTANVAHPGHVKTAIWDLWPQPTWYQRLFLNLHATFMISAEAGAQTPLYLATSPAVAGVTGGYFAKQQQRPVATLAQNLVLQRALWALAQRLTGARWG
ncbi:SDR family oxidoreductase [Candidatus Oscillochloris fontis]|uniref:SDR family oxidoreductase n=1 Tax=Candidatus Oscillochloris fontis TaxID=2496868 RepID=UPI00101DB545|nr:SDR family oxidoreductase [Candidatus Oscillochloris fontis]